MKKITLITLVLCALSFGALYALNTAEAPATVETDVTASLTLEQVLPGTVLTMNANPNCPRDIQCPAVYDPVICNDGNVYSNSCVAYRECAKGCSPYLPEM